MSKKSIPQMIDMWPTRRELAADVGANLDAVHKWAQKNSIPAHWQASFVEAAKRRGFMISADDVDAAHDLRREGAA